MTAKWATAELSRSRLMDIYRAVPESSRPSLLGETEVKHDVWAESDDGSGKASGKKSGEVSDEKPSNNSDNG